MKKLLFIFVATIPALVMGMENGAIKLYSVERLKQGYEELFPISNGSLDKGWGSPYGGITLERPMAATVGVACTLITGGLGPLFSTHLMGVLSAAINPEGEWIGQETIEIEGVRIVRKGYHNGCEYYQPKLTDIAVANLLVYCQKHADRMNELQIRLVEINNGVVNQQRIFGNQLDQLIREQDMPDHRATRDTVLGRRRSHIQELQRQIDSTYNLRTAEIAGLREANLGRERVLCRHDNVMNFLTEDIRNSNADLEDYKVVINALQNNLNQHDNIDQHRAAIERHADQIKQLQQDVSVHVNSVGNSYDNDINQFVRKKIQDTPSQDASKSARIKELCEDIALLKKTLNAWMPEVVETDHDKVVETHYDQKQEENTTSSCSTMGK